MAVPAGVARVEEIKDAALAELESVESADQTDLWRVTFLGRNGRLTEVLRGIRELPAEDRGSVGAAANSAKRALEAAMELRRTDLSAAQADRAPSIDVTLPGWPVVRGGLHPTTRTMREVGDAFVSMGFQIVEGPEVELDSYNFEMLNIPKYHPARDMWNTLWVDGDAGQSGHETLLRTHTSPMQARIMEAQEPPVRVIVPGRCYRYEATDASHEWHFFQLEGLAVDRGITFADLKGTLWEFARRVFGESRQVRFRCDYFPFVEPGAEMAIDCFLCEGKGCRVCQGSGWIEILGAGMVHPNVLRGVGYDPNIYTGFAFGMGIERIAMLKHGIDDIRHFYSNNLQFLRQF
jgi:phenylalanyl-tRNA synthetase alpha chain